VAQELALAGQIQASFLPSDLLVVPGWQLAATLEPARETSGDFYDFFPLRGGQLGIVIADTADKGMGAALYMALCRTLIRTYAAEHQSQPHRVLSATNRRILSDARAGLFVTVFYGILDPESGTLTYCSAGHHPPYILRARGEEAVQPLHRTGMALGVIEEESWGQQSVQLCPGDLLLLYTDGVPEAQDVLGRFFGWERLLETALNNLAPPDPVESLAQYIHDALIAEVQRFMGDTPQFDDMTLLVLTRDKDEGPTTDDGIRSPSKH
jgi:sigma-B regulation protein RsbU (phosphoserine phosphatase)